MKSLRARLLVVWALSLASASVVGFLLVQLYRQSATAQLDRAAAAAAQACERIADGYAYYTTGWTPRLPAGADTALQTDLSAMVALALAGSPAKEGGIWQTESGRDPVPLAYAGPAGKALPPGEEHDRVAALNGASAQSGQPENDQLGTGRQTALLQACPLHGPLPGITGWTTVRVAAIAGQTDLMAGVAVLLGLVLALAGFLGWLMLSWGRHVRRIEATLATAGADALPPLALTGEAELDRIVTALNTASQRLTEAHRRSEELAARVAGAERLAALGRVAAGVAHEIRNPMAAMRLRAENALAGDDARRRAALEAILAQIARLDRLVAELLAMTQRRQPKPEPVDLAALLPAIADDHRREGVALRVETPPALPARLDPALLRRTLDALLENAAHHTPAGGTVTLSAHRQGAAVRLAVADTGPGIAPEVAKNLFEPFVTGRADGTGLGLAIARELAESQGGRLALARAGGDMPGEGAMFVLEIPCPAS